MTEGHIVIRLTAVFSSPMLVGEISSNLHRNWLPKGLPKAAAKGTANDWAVGSANDAKLAAKGTGQRLSH